MNRVLEIVKLLKASSTLSFAEEKALRLALIIAVAETNAQVHFQLFQGSIYRSDSQVPCGLVWQQGDKEAVWQLVPSSQRPSFRSANLEEGEILDDLEDGEIQQ